MLQQLPKKQFGISLLIALAMMFGTQKICAQVNLALSATAAHSGGGATSAGYGPENYNDGIISSYTSCPPVTCPTPWGWLTGPSTTNWIEYTWTAAQTITKVVFYKADRPMYTCTIQWWDGSAYQTAANYSNSAACYQDSITFSAVTTNKLRFYGIQGSSNPNHREIQVFGGVCTGTPQSPTITTAAQTTPLCSGGTFSMTATNTGASPSILYQWESSASSSGPWSNVVGGTGAATLSYTTGALTSTTYYRVKATCGTNIGYSTNTYMVQVGMPTPGAITGNPFCPGNNATYSVPAIAGATSYTWTLPSGWTGTSTTNSITAIPNSTAGNITVTVTGACGTSSPQTLAVILGTAPPQPGTIAGNNIVCNATNQTYTITAVNTASSYTWTVPSGWTGSSSTNSLITTTTSTPGNITVTAVNGCGMSQPQNLAVTITTSPPPMPSVISGNNSVCPSASQTYTTPVIPNVLSYAWTIPSGWTGTSTTNSIVTTPNNTSGTISVTAFNGCGTSPARTFSINVNPQVVPAVNILTQNTTVCNNVTTVFTAAPTNGGITPNYQWKQNGIFVGSNSSTFTTSTLSNNDIITVVLTSGAPCPVPASVNSNQLTMTILPNTIPGININANAPLSICAGSGITFSANITGGGTTPIYQWMKNASQVGTNSPTYSGSNFVNGDSISCIMTTNALCPLMTTANSNRMGLKVTQMVTPSALVTASPGTIITPGQQVTFAVTISNGGTQPEYQWIKNSQDIPNENGNTYTTNNLHEGDQVSVRLISNATCAFPFSVNSNKVTVHTTTSASNINAEDVRLSLVPNPNNGQFVLTGYWKGMSKGKTVQVEVLNTIGQTVYISKDEIINEQEWSKTIRLTDNMPAGLYVLKLSTDGKMMIRKFELNK